MVRMMSPERVKSNTEEGKSLSRQERIDKLRQDEQQLELIIRQRDAVNEFFKETGHNNLVGIFVDPDGAVLGIKNRHHGIAPNDWLVVRCASSEGDKNRPEIKKISSVKKTERGKYPFWPIGVKTIDTLYLEEGSFNVFWPESSDKPKSDSKTKIKVRKPVVGDFAGRVFLPIDEIIDPEIEAEIEAKIKAKKEVDEFNRLVQPLKDEGLGEGVEQGVKIRGGLGASAVSGAVLLQTSQTR